MKNKTIWILAVLLGLNVAAGIWFFGRPRYQPGASDDRALAGALNGITDDYRRVIVLMEGAENLDDATRARCLSAGKQIFFHKEHALNDVARKLTEARDAGNMDSLHQVARYLTGSALHDADKLAFLDLLDQLGDTVPDDLKAVRDNLQSIQLAYREEVTRIFSQFATRGPAGTREKWDAYVRFLRTLHSRDRILAEFPDLPPEDLQGQSRGAGDTDSEVFGYNFAPKSVAITFDDGPHPKYTEEVLALLRKYGIRACFFELGENLGAVTGDQVKLGRTAAISKEVLAEGHTIANHSFSHPVLSKLTEAQRTSEIERTNTLLTQIAGHKPDLFRAPYGARNKAIIDQVNGEGMKSIMWTVDSLDWSDPIPESIAMRVLHQLNQTHKGIILFHDIHKQSVMALPAVIEELMRQDYTFLAYDNGKFVKTAAPVSTERTNQPPVQQTAAPTPEHPKFYRESWAVIIGINDYANWPKLRYAVNDANGVEEALVSQFGFKRSNIIKLVNGDATRQRIMEVLGDDFTDGNKIQREDRIFFFFAGHGATRTMADGRQIGFIVPVDADRANYYATAISMATLRDACDLIPAKHIYFVMDSCYSGLALTRGAGGFSRDRTYLEEVTHRVARQILTAGGADQQVSDDGPNGHSVFTWAFLQGLQGKADLDGNGFITASELGAYVSPIVAQFSKQTPVVGNMVGSEGGEFIFELTPQPLTSLSTQLNAPEIKLNSQLATLEKEIAAKQAELLKLQQSIQSLSQVAHAPPPVVAAKPKMESAYDLDRDARQLYSERKYDEALAKEQEAVGRKPNDAILLNNLGFLYYRKGDYERALDYLQKTVAADPKRKEAYGNLADTYLKLGKKEEARKNYEQYLVMYPGTPRAAEIRGALAGLK